MSHTEPSFIEAVAADVRSGDIVRFASAWHKIRTINPYPSGRVLELSKESGGVVVLAASDSVHILTGWN